MNFRVAYLAERHQVTPMEAGLEHCQALVLSCGSFCRGLKRTLAGAAARDQPTLRWRISSHEALGFSFLQVAAGFVFFKTRVVMC